MVAIALESLGVHRAGVEVLRDVTFDVASGESICLLGSSGSGKSSLLRVIAGLDTPSVGSVAVDGLAMTGPRKEVTMVFETDAVYDHLDVGGNLGFPFRLAGDRSDQSEQVRGVASRFAVRRMLDLPPLALSSGQRRLVSAARALVRPEVRVALLDEPLAGTDPHLRSRLLGAIVDRPGLTVVLATNQPSDCFRWGDRVVVLTAGAVAQIGHPGEVYRRPVSLEVAELMGEMNRLPAIMAERGTAVVGGSEISVGQSREQPERGAKVVLGVRPEMLELASAVTPFRQRLRANIGRVEPLGASQRVLFGLGDQPGFGFAATLDRTVALAAGQRVDWFVNPDSVRLFDPVTLRAW